MNLHLGEHPPRGVIRIARSHGRDIVALRLDRGGKEGSEYYLTQDEIAALTYALNVLEEEPNA